MAIEPKSAEECRHFLRPGVYELIGKGVDEARAEVVVDKCAATFEREGWEAAKREWLETKRALTGR